MISSDPFETTHADNIRKADAIPDQRIAKHPKGKISRFDR
jgi:hypothetical protein